MERKKQKYTETMVWKIRMPKCTPGSPLKANLWCEEKYLNQVGGGKRKPRKFS